ncbi:hypothetical protein JW721_02775 [Candidatus Micrarchaeota archaeon]|nr:hypothetical protein [Candidatus Micrarchaeota archaeon]
MAGKKGFFFVIVAFVLLSYILASTYVWVRAIEMEESRYSEAFRAASVEMLISQVTEGRIAEFTNISSHYALYRLNHHAIFHPVRVPSGVDIHAGGELDGSELANIRLAMRELMLYGRASGDYFEDGQPIEYTGEEKLTYSLEGWKTQLNSSLRASGFELEELEFSEEDFVFNNTGFMKFNVSFMMGIKIADTLAGSATSIARTYNVSMELNAEGMPDAYIARESVRQLHIADDNTIVGKRVFMAPYADEGYEALCSGSSSGPCYYVDSGSEGQGWFYGPVVMAADSGDVPGGATYNYILAGTYSQITSADNWKGFGAYIVTSEPEEGPECSEQLETFNALEYDEDCEDVFVNNVYEETERPFVVYENFDIDDFGGYDSSMGAAAHKVLFVSEYSVEEVGDEPELKLRDVAIYDIEGLRDFVMCGYYMPRPQSPSFLHRMFDLQDMFEDSDPAYNRWPENEWGIETTAAGRWAGGDLVSSSWDDHSRLDIEFFLDTGDVNSDVDVVRGMFGCKNALLCGMGFGADIENVGHFAISDWARWDRPSSGETPSDEIYYIDTEDSDDAEADNIGCDNNGRASCYEN